MMAALAIVAGACSTSAEDEAASDEASNQDSPTTSSTAVASEDGPVNQPSGAAELANQVLKSIVAADGDSYLQLFPPEFRELYGSPDEGISSQCLSDGLDRAFANVDFGAANVGEPGVLPGSVFATDANGVSVFQGTQRVAVPVRGHQGGPPNLDWILNLRDPSGMPLGGVEGLYEIPLVYDGSWHLSPLYPALFFDCLWS